MELNVGTIFFYELILLAFMLIFRGANSLKIREHDSFSKRHLVMYIILCAIITIVSTITIFSFTMGQQGIIFPLLGSLAVALSTVTFVKEDKVQESLSKKKDLKNMPRKKETRNFAIEHSIAFEKRKTEESILLFSIPIMYFIAIAVPYIFPFSQEDLIYKAIDLLTAIAIGVISGLVIIAIKRKHVIILMTIGTCTFLVGDAICRMGLLSVAVCALFYSNMADHEILNQKSKQKEEKDTYRIITLLQIAVFISMGIFAFGHLSVVSLIITAAIIAARLIMKEINISVSMIPLATLFCINRIFPGISQIVNMILPALFFLMAFSVIININDIILRIKSAFRQD